MTRLPRTIEQRLAAHRSAPESCWTGAWKPEKTGYVRIWLHPSEREAGRIGEFDLIHRVAYRLWVGPIPERFQIDHLCRNRACFNPRHLEAVPARENIRRSTAPSAKNALKTHCKRGHAFTAGNTIWRAPARAGRAPMRVCRTCDEARQKLIVAPDFEELRARYRRQVDEAGIGGPRRAVPTHCKRGHAYDEANTYFYIGTYRRRDGSLSVQRGCRKCRKSYWKKYESDPEKYAHKQERKNAARNARYAATKDVHK